MFTSAFNYEYAIRSSEGIKYTNDYNEAFNMFCETKGSKLYYLAGKRNEATYVYFKLAG